MEVSDDHVVVEDKTEETQQDEAPQQQLNGKKISWPKLPRYDSLDIESRSVPDHAHAHGSKVDLSISNTFFFFFHIFPPLHDIVLMLHIIIIFFFPYILKPFSSTTYSLRFNYLFCGYIYNVFRQVWGGRWCCI